MNDELSIGIDLGTTYCYVGIYKNGNVDIIPNEIGLTTTPSIVSFTANERLVGEGAKSQLIKNLKIQFMILNFLLEESLMIQKFKIILNFGHLK